MYTPFHSYTDIELVHHLLMSIEHLAVTELCQRVLDVPCDLDDVPDQEELDTANERIDELEDEVAQLEYENSCLQIEIQTLKEEVEGLDYVIKEGA